MGKREGGGGYLDPQLLEGGGQQQASDLRDDWAVHTRHDDGLPLPQSPVDQDHIDGGPHPRKGLHLEPEAHVSGPPC